MSYDAITAPISTRDEKIVRSVQKYCALLLQQGNGWTQKDAEYVAAIINQSDDPWGLFRFMDEKTGHWQVGYRLPEYGEWFPILRQMRNTVGSGLLENLRRKA